LTCSLGLIYLANKCKILEESYSAFQIMK